MLYLQDLLEDTPLQSRDLKKIQAVSLKSMEELLSFSEISAIRG